tara:strand:+ start:7168 stop:7563 length:396 start_codon:yes stop_codon:yes gene_type:complete
MAGKIVADTLEHSTAGSVNTTHVVLGSTKAYSLWDMADLSGTGGTTGIDTSLNVSSMDDDGTGDFGMNFTTAFTTANYVAVSATGNGARRVLTRSPTDTATPGAMDGLIRNDSNNAADAVSCSVACNGILA